MIFAGVDTDSLGQNFAVITFTSMNGACFNLQNFYNRPFLQNPIHRPLDTR